MAVWEVSNDEIIQANFQMATCKVKGPYDFEADFSRKSWETVGPDIFLVAK